MFSSRVTSELQHARLVSPLRLIREALGDPSRVTDQGSRPTPPTSRASASWGSARSS
jgi:hypothetical protein